MCEHDWVTVATKEFPVAWCSSVTKESRVCILCEEIDDQIGEYERKLAEALKEQDRRLQLAKEIWDRKHDV